MYSTMNTPLRILYLEKKTADAALICSTLQAGDIACTTVWVQNLAEFEAQLSRGCFDLVLSAHSLLGRV